MYENWKQISGNDHAQIEAVYRCLESLSSEYPDFATWYWNKVVPELKTSKRIIKCCYLGQKIAGIIILKDTVDEKKICTLRVFDEFQRRGIGEKLLNCAKFSLHCEKPLVTVPQVHFQEYKELFAKAGFIVYKVYSDYYKHGSKEYAYNGFLVADSKKVVRIAR